MLTVRERRGGESATLRRRAAASSTNVPPPLGTVPELLHYQACLRGSDIALTVEGVGSLSYAQLAERGRDIAGRLLAAGVSPGDRVGILSSDAAGGLDYATLYFGLQMVSAVPVLLPPAVVQSAVALAQPELVIAVPDAGSIEVDAPLLTFDEIERKRPLHVPTELLPSRDAPGQIVFTSGTTGSTPSPVLCFHGELASPYPIQLPPMIEARPFEQCCFQNIALGMPYFWFKFDPERFCYLVAEHSITHCLLFAHMAQQVALETAARKLDLSSMRSVRVTGSGTAPYVAERLLEMFGNATLLNLYSSTECFPAMTCKAYWRHDLSSIGRMLSAGRATSAATLEIVDDAGEPVPQGEVGRVRFRIREDIPMRRVIGKEHDDVGRTVYPGDVGRLNEDDELFILARWREKVHRGAYDVLNAEVESVLLEHPAVLDAAIAAVPDRRLGEEVGALVVTDGSIDEESILEFCMERLPAIQVPRYLRIVDQLPRTRVGKVDRMAASRMLMECAYI